MAVADLGMREDSDDELMRRVQADDTAAFGQLYDRYADRALRVAFSVCGDRGRAEDAVQDGFTSMWRERAGYQPAGGSFPAWSMQAVLNRALDSVPRHGADGHLPVSLARLPVAQAEVIALAFFGELSQAEIGRELSLPDGTVSGRMRLGLEKLRRDMGEHLHDGGRSG